MNLNAVRRDSDEKKSYSHATLRVACMHGTCSSFVVPTSSIVKRTAFMSLWFLAGFVVLFALLVLVVGTAVASEL